MTASTVRPNSTVSSTTGTPITGAATRHAALSDDSDASYVTLNNVGDAMELGTPDPAAGMPAGSHKVALLLLLRLAKQSGLGTPNVAGIFHDLLTSIPPGITSVTWTTPTTIFSIVANGDFDDTNIDIARTTDSAPLKPKVYEAYVTLVYVVKPVVASIVVNATDETQPLVGGSFTLDEEAYWGGSAQYMDVKIFTDAQHSLGGFDPATTAPVAASDPVPPGFGWRVDEPLANGNYWAYMRVAQIPRGETDPFWSDWSGQAFTVSVPRPTAPTMVLTPESEFGRIKIDLTDHATSPDTDWLYVERSDDGDTWYPIFTTEGDGKVATSSPVAYDYEAPNGAVSYYRARAVHDWSPGTSESDWDTGTASWSSGWWWVKDSYRPELNFAVMLRSQPGHTRVVPRSVTKALGAKFPQVILDNRQSDEGQVVFRLGTKGERTRLDTLLDEADSPLFLQGPETAEWRNRWLSFGDLDEERALDASWGRFTFDTLDWSEVPRPDVSTPVVAWIDPVPADSDDEDMVIL